MVKNQCRICRSQLTPKARALSSRRTGRPVMCVDALPAAKVALAAQILLASTVELPDQDDASS